MTESAQLHISTIVCRSLFFYIHSMWNMHVLQQKQDRCITAPFNYLQILNLEVGVKWLVDHIMPPNSYSHDIQSNYRLQWTTAHCEDMQLPHHLHNTCMWKESTQDCLDRPVISQATNQRTPPRSLDERHHWKVPLYTHLAHRGKYHSISVRTQHDRKCTASHQY